MSVPDGRGRPKVPFPEVQRWAQYYRGWVPWVLVAAHMAIIFALSSVPGARVSAWNVWKVPDAVGHGFLYAVLGLLLFGAFRQRERSIGRAAVYSVVVAVLYGMSDEVHQRYVPGRSPDVLDVLWDSVGAVLGVGWASAYAVRRTRLGSSPGPVSD